MQTILTITKILLSLINLESEIYLEEGPILKLLVDSFTLLKNADHIQCK